MIVSDLLKKRFHHGLPPNAYFWRDKAGVEVDCILEEGARLAPIEIKPGATIQSDMFDNLAKWCTLAKIPPKEGKVIYAGNEVQARERGQIIS